MNIILVIICVLFLAWISYLVYIMTRTTYPTPKAWAKAKVVVEENDRLVFGGHRELQELIDGVYGDDKHTIKGRL